MKIKKSLRSFVVILLLPLLLIFCGCEDVEHHEVDFSAEGDYLVMVSNIVDQSCENEQGISSIVVKNTREEDAEPIEIYTAPKGFKVYDVFWKGDYIVFFESGERWDCPEKPGKNEEVPPDEMPLYSVRIAKIPVADVENQKTFEVEEIAIEDFDCWERKTRTWTDDDTQEQREEEYWSATRVLGFSVISSDKSSDFIYFENFDEEDEKRPILRLNASNSKIKGMFAGRDVDNPSISYDGRYLAFNELIKNEDDEEGRYLAKVRNLETGNEKEVFKISGGEVSTQEAKWSKDSKYLFFESWMDISITMICDRELLKQEEEAEDDYDGPEPCKAVKGPVREKKREPDKYTYEQFAMTWGFLYKYYLDYGIAVRLTPDPIWDFSLNPEKKEILVTYVQLHEDAREGEQIIDYSGGIVREADYEHLEEYEAVDKDGNVADSVVERTGDDYERMAVVVDSRTDREKLISKRKHELLAKARGYFDAGDLENTKKYFDRYFKKHRLPEDDGDKLLMVETYKKTNEYGKVMKLTKRIPVRTLQNYKEHAKFLD